VLARRFTLDSRWRGWLAYSILTGPVVLAMFVASNVSSVLDGTSAVPVAPTGLLQRIGSMTGWGWIALLALRLLRADGRAGAGASGGASRQGQPASQRVTLMAMIVETRRCRVSPVGGPRHSVLLPIHQAGRNRITSSVPAYDWAPIRVCR
jgi:hypothetical protein